MNDKVCIFAAAALGAAMAFAAPDAKAILRDLRRFQQTVATEPDDKLANSGGKDWKKLADIERRALDLLSPGENAPNNVSASELHLAIAGAYGRPIHIRHLARAEAAYGEALKTAKTPDEQALARYWYADFKYREANDDGRKWIEEKKAAYAIAGISPATRLDLLSAGVPGLRYEEDGWKVVENAPDYQRQYFDWLLGWQRYPARNQLTWFDRRGDAEHLLEICDKAIRVGRERDRDYYRRRRREYLKQLGRLGEVEAELESRVSALKKPNEKASALADLAAFTAERAGRFAAPADEEILASAFDLYDRAIKTDPRNAGIVRDCVDLAMKNRRYDIAERILAGRADERPDRRTAGILGDIAYYRGDYETAVKWYLSHEKMDNYDRHPPNRQDRIAESLFALGRYEEALKKAENLSGWFVWSDYKADVIATLKAKIAAGETAKPEPCRGASERNEYSAAFWVKFDTLPSVGNPMKDFLVKADADGRISVTLKALPTELKGDFTFPGVAKFEKGGWHHVEFTYSLMRRRAALYVDGLFQWENDNLHLPRVRSANLDTSDFEGETADFVSYPYQRRNEELACATLCRLASAVRAAKAVSAKLPDDAPPGLKDWAARLAKAADELNGKSRSVDGRHAQATVDEVKNLERDADDILAFARKSRLGMADDFALWTMPPLVQQPVLPRTMPAEGTVTNAARVFLCRDEYESLGIVVSAFRPLTVRRVSVGELRGPNGAKIAAGETDVKLVKRWYRSEGAWLSYFCDPRGRELVPDLLVNDDDLIRVDETERRNYFRLDYPSGRRYVDVSDPSLPHVAWKADVPFQDAATLQPAKIPSAGRNLQYLLRFHAAKNAKPGVYRGEILVETDAGTKSVALELKVLDVDLPLMGSPYDDLSKTYISHVNSLPAPEGVTKEDKLRFMRQMIRDAKRHNLYHMTDLWRTPETARIAREEGLVPDRIFGTPAPHPVYWANYLKGVPVDEISVAEREKAIACSVRDARTKAGTLFDDYPESTFWTLYHSESARWSVLGYNEGEERAVLSRLPRVRLFAHGWDNNSRWATDSQAMHSSTTISRAEADRWHSTGAEMINYADPFPGSENPAWFRRRPGLQMYFARMNGQMMHGWRQGRTLWNEWAADWGGDGFYRNFCMSYPQKGGSIYKLAAEGLREAYDDVRYATRLKQLASANRAAKDDDLARESMRALRWLDAFDSEHGDLEAFRACVARRLEVLTRQIRARGGVMPDPDQAIRKVLDAMKEAK